MERARTLVRTFALPLVPQRIDSIDIARSAIVLGSALALIFAGPLLPL